MIAFAANSVLCRLALGTHAIDAAAFTLLRLLSGAVVLFFITLLPTSGQPASKGSWSSALMLFLYAVSFSYAYLSLDTGTGALLLFGAVQITMITLSLFSGSRMHVAEWIGVVIAFTGFVYLVLPGITTPSALGFMLMTVAGIAWGIYTLKGRRSKNPLADTAYNFIRTMPLVLVLSFFTFSNMYYTQDGVVLALISGGITSGIGYTIWYIALGGLSVVQAAVLQLSVPVIAALGGVIFIAEAITLRLVLSALLVLGGILIVVLGKYHYTSR